MPVSVARVGVEVCVEDVAPGQLISQGTAQPALAVLISNERVTIAATATPSPQLFILYKERRRF